MIMKSAKNIRWILPFKKIRMVRVNYQPWTPQYVQKKRKQVKMFFTVMLIFVSQCDKNVPPVRGLNLEP